MRILLLLTALLGLAACATLSESECRDGNWYQIGRDDGAAGRPLDFIRQHAKACNEFGVAPKAKPWREGRLEGLKQYCTRPNAYDVGTRGRRLSPVCPAEDIESLQAANARGLRWYQIGQEIAEVERDIRAINAEIADLAADDPGRAALFSERSFLRLDVLRLRSRRMRYRY